MLKRNEPITSINNKNSLISNTHNVPPKNSGENLISSIENFTLSLTEASDSLLESPKLLFSSSYFPKVLTNLKKIKLRINRVDNSSKTSKVINILKGYFDSLNQFKGLESFTLDLSMTNKDICEIALNMIQKSGLCFDQLKKLKINLSQIGDNVDFSPLKDILKNCPGLQRLGLDFSGNKKVESLKEILFKVRKMEKLEVLKLNLFDSTVKNNIITDVICEIMAELKFLKIVRKN